MGRKTGIFLVGLGVFVVALGLLSRFYVYDRLAVAPLDEDTVQVSTGPRATIFDIGSQREIVTNLVSKQTVVGKVAASEQASKQQGRDLAVWDTSIITTPPGALVNKQNPPLAGEHDLVPFDRRTGVAVNCCGKFLSSTADLKTGTEVRDTSTPITGQYYKLPFDAQKQTYQFWDGTLKKSTALQYRGTEEIKGLTVYRYEQDIAPTKVASLEAPASWFGIKGTGNVKLDKIYANTRTLWVEPETGVIIRGQENQNVTAEYQGKQVGTLTKVVIGYNAKTINDNIDTYSPLATQLKIIHVWAPLVGIVVGTLLILMGIGLIGRRASGRRAVR